MWLFIGFRRYGDAAKTLAFSHDGKATEAALVAGAMLAAVPPSKVQSVDMRMRLGMRLRTCRRTRPGAVPANRQHQLLPQLKRPAIEAASMQFRLQFGPVLFQLGNGGL